MKFKLTFGHSGEVSPYGPHNEQEAYDSVASIMDEYRLRELDIGETYTDSDGDTWERIE